jgi:hypothetical protein
MLFWFLVSLFSLYVWVSHACHVMSFHARPIAQIQFQVFCFLIGAMALASVRRQKSFSASLFDQRKIGEQQKPRGRRSSSDAEEEEEMVEFNRVDLESVPLVDTSSNPLEVI